MLKPIALALVALLAFVPNLSPVAAGHDDTKDCDIRVLDLSTLTKEKIYLTCNGVYRETNEVADLQTEGYYTLDARGRQTYVKADEMLLS